MQCSGMRGVLAYRYDTKGRVVRREKKKRKGEERERREQRETQKEQKEQHSRTRVIKKGMYLFSLLARYQSAERIGLLGRERIDTALETRRLSGNDNTRLTTEA